MICASSSFFAILKLPAVRGGRAAMESSGGPVVTSPEFLFPTLARGQGCYSIPDNHSLVSGRSLLSFCAPGLLLLM
jgi:hypothetical protein